MADKTKSPQLSPRYTKVEPDMVWPSLNQGDMEWELRYGTEFEVVKHRLVTASIVAAYQSLIRMTIKDRNKVCTALKAGALKEGKE
jgi:hypothetical protein